ncbi:MAG TPA: LysM domain-containing protein [Gaiellaceae bacterium]|nr:LysM domain-containing protein [Gaiellaceae bacterium]
MERSRITRWAAPVAFLAAVTIGALLVRSGLQHGKHHATKPATTLTAKSKQHHGHAHRRPKTYTVEQDDTLESIATKTGTTVARLLKLNPGVNPTALRVGQRIRVQ